MARKKKRRRHALGGVVRTCVRYHKKGGVMRCAQFAPAPGCPPFRGQRKRFSECTSRSRTRFVSSLPC